MRLWASCKGCLETDERFAHMTDDEFSTFMQASVQMCIRDRLWSVTEWQRAISLS